MSGWTRREIVAAAGTLVFVGAAAPARAGAPTLAIYDSRLLHGRALAFAVRSRGGREHDIARENDQLWRSSRALNLRPGDTVTGATGWTEFVALRGLLIDRGLRVRELTRLDGAGSPFAWTMA